MDGELLGLGRVSAGVRGGLKRRRMMKATRNFIFICTYILYTLYILDLTLGLNIAHIDTRNMKLNKKRLEL